MNARLFLLAKAGAVLALALAAAGCDESASVVLAVGRLAAEAAEAQIDRALPARSPEPPKPTVAATTPAGRDFSAEFAEAQKALSAKPDSEIDIPTF